jgi:hypothetical protein
MRETKYKRGFPTITFNFPEDLEIPLFKIYAEEHLDTASASFMKGVTKRNLKKRVFKMIRNAIIVEAIVEGLERERARNPDQLSLELD